MKRIIIFLILVIVALVLLLIGVSMEKEKPIKKNENKQVKIKDEYKLNINIDEETFPVTLEDNNAVTEFMKLLPMKIVMSDLNDNEKYYYLEKSLPTDEKNYSTIDVGDIMLFGDNCLVIFYEKHSSYYNYTRIGKIDNIDNLKQVLKNNDKEITFELIKE